MGEYESPNLIDLTDDNARNIIPVTPIALIPSPLGRLSLENNPFDYVQNLTLRPDDPFDVVEKEASVQARLCLAQPPADVKLANLLSLSPLTEDSKNTEQGSTWSTTTDSTRYHTAENDLENESPPITVSMKWTPKSSESSCSGGVSCESSDSASKTQVNGIKTRKVREHRNRLLKISITNSTFNTPLSRQSTNGLGGLACDELGCSPIPGEPRTVGSTEEDILAAESPLKFVDDIMSEEPPDTIYVERDFDADLELLKIPMLKSSSNAEANKVHIETDLGLKKINDDVQESKSLLSNLSQNAEVSTIAPLPDLASLRSKLRTKRMETNNTSDVSKMIQNLKRIIGETNIVDEQKRQEANELLETLSSALIAPKKGNETEIEAEQSTPQPIVRQGTFDLDLKDNKSNIDKVETNEEQLVDSDQRRPQPMEATAIEDMPDIMLKSSATYDGESGEENAHLNLPEIDPLSPPDKPSIQTNLNEVLEQLQLFLEQHHLHPQPHFDSNESTNINNVSAGTQNPTFIVVMPTVSQQPLCEEPDGYKNSSTMRRRSQSLSIHDKLKIVQLPIKPTAIANHSEAYDSPPTIKVSSTDNEATEFKTPSRFLSRRNSFSSHTPYTPTRYSRLNTSGHVNGHLTPRIRSNVMETHNETLPPIPMPRNLNLIKPDPKKKVKASSSIFKSNGPLKATLPLKHVMPAIKTTAALPNTTKFNANTSMHLVAKSGPISNTSTPTPASRNNGLRAPNTNYSSAFSTPHTLRTTLLDPGLANNKARCSNISTTPLRKSHIGVSAAPCNLKRRTISDFKIKSPTKSRSTDSGTSISNRSNISRPNFSKTSTYSRVAANGATGYLANKNKENKQP